MEPCVILDNIQAEWNMGRLIKSLRLEGKAGYIKEFEQLAQEAAAVARPKALYRTCFVETKGDDHVVVDGRRLVGRVMRVNLDGAHRIFPFVATCGAELDEWSAGIKDLLKKFWADRLMEEALRLAFKALKSDLVERFDPGRVSSMTPGSLEDWPLDQQGELFALLGVDVSEIGVNLTASMCMVPIKSISGILFPSETSFFSCRLCPREKCPGRRAAYDPELYKNKYGPDARI